MTPCQAVACLALNLMAGSAAHAADLQCTSAYVYRLDAGETEYGGWESKDGRIAVSVRPDMQLKGPFGILVCTTGETRIEFFKP